ncbi:ninein isoform X1 [Clarias gariepinus]|uniref:ninein isoform X1 n=2 Tax=Clarias gariepinus TaxID=13013 RepID=UPI00234D3AA7|nr:ninein isoform X1 [Clarias gariepinus]
MIFHQVGISAETCFKKRSRGARAWILALTAGRLMDGEGDQRDQHEERLKEVFLSFDGSGAGSLSPEELTELCHSLQLTDQALQTLIHRLFDTQDQLNLRVEFEQFRDALILVLSSNDETLAKENPPRPVSPEVQPRFVKGTKRYGRRSTPEYTQTVPDLAHTPSVEKERDEATRSSDGTLPVKRERWNADVSSSEEYEAEGQLHLWNPDEPGTPRGSMAPLSDQEERLSSICEQLSLDLHSTATIQQLRMLCQHLGLEVEEDVFQSADEENVSVQEFLSCIQTNSKPPTPSASTPYRQLKRHHSTQPFDEMGRRIASVKSSTIGLRLFSELDDGTGHTAVELLLDAWLEEGVENGSEILQALDFSLGGKVNLSELTAALENELMVTKNSIHQAALASFKAEIRCLLERVDLELRQKEKLHSDLEKAEKLKSQLASEVDEHHSTIERINDLNLRKLEQEHKDRVVSLRADLCKEVELVQQQANQQREELEQEMSRIREDETYLREHLTLTVKENRRLEAELLDSTERLIEADAQINKLQKNLDNVLREKFGDLDLSNAEFYQHEERLRQLRNSYEEQCRELQDRIDELQAQLEDFRALSRAPQTSLMPPLSDELESKSPGMESDQGLGSEDGQPFNMSLEAEMMLEQLKEQHCRELEDIRTQLDSTVNKCEHRLEEQKSSIEEERSLLSLQHQQEIKGIREELNEALKQARDLQEQLEQERRNMEAQQSVERAELHAVYQQKVGSLSQELQNARTHALNLEEQLRVLEEQERAVEESRLREMEELSRTHAEELCRMELHYKEALETSLQRQKEEAERSLSDELENERQHLKEVYEEVLRVRLEEVQQRAEQERTELERSLREEFESDKQKLEENNRKKLEQELERLEKGQEESSKRLREHWEKERNLLQKQHYAELQKCLQQERERLQAQEQDEEQRRMEWERERVLLHKQNEEVLQARLEEQRAQLQAQKEEEKRVWQKVLEDQQGQSEETHREAMSELSAKHTEERERLSCMLEKLHADIVKERSEAGRLAEENLLLRQNISELREEDLKEKQQELLLKVEHLRKEKNAAQKMANGLKRQISELRRRGKQREEENNVLSQQSGKHALGVDALQHTLEEVMLHHGKGFPSWEKVEIEEGGFASPVGRTEKLEEEKKLLRAELNRCVEKMAQLRTAETQLAQLLHERQLADKHNQALRTQMMKAQESVQALDFTLQGLTQQNARLKSDLRITQQERDALKQEVISLHKQLQNANEKCRLLEKSGVPLSSHQGKRVWAELSGLMEAELSVLREENQRLHREINDARLELSSAREKARHLEALVLSLKQQKQQNQASLAKTAEQERSALKRELEALQTQLHNKLCDSSEEQREIENLHDENERLRNRQTVLESQLMEAQVIAMLPPSPQRSSAERRGQCHGDEMNPDINKEKALFKMEERMKEVELKLRNVKLLLQEKVSQLKEQLNKNSKSDVLIKDLYVENSQLLKALEVSEQRQKVAEKRNYLLEEKISSLNKIVRELSPSPLMPVPYHMTRS